MNRCYLQWYSCSSKNSFEQKCDTDEKNNPKYLYCDIRTQKTFVTGRKEGEWARNEPEVLSCVRRFFFFILLLMILHRCLLIVNKEPLIIYKLLYFMLCFPWFKDKDISDTKEVFQKEKNPHGSLYMDCGFCSLVAQCEKGIYRAEVSSGKW